MPLPSSRCQSQAVHGAPEKEVDLIFLPCDSLAVKIKLPVRET